MSRGEIKYVSLTTRFDEMEFNSLVYRGIKVQEFSEIGKIFSTSQTLINFLNLYIAFNLDYKT